MRTFRSLVLLAMFVYGLSLIGAGLAQRGLARAPQAQAADAGEQALPAASAASSPGSASTPADSSAASLPNPVLGFAINLHHTERLELYLKAVDELADMGFNSVEVLTPAFQADGAAQEIEVISGPGRGPTREQLLTLLRHARKRKLHVALMPVVLFAKPRGNEWRGKISPEDWDPWWQSYRKTILHFAQIARDGDVSVFSVGSELLSTERQTERWEETIAAIRGVFPGKLTYSTNWDHYHVPTFWKQLDLIGINGYWNITGSGKNGGTDPANLAKSWREIREKVLEFSRSVNRPVLFTEIGYPSLPWGLKDPWNYINTDHTPSDPGTQAKGYQAFLGAWSDMLDPAQPKTQPPCLRGVFFYEWDVYRQGEENDTGYGIRGKDAHGLLKEFLAKQKEQ